LKEGYPFWVAFFLSGYLVFCQRLRTFEITMKNIILFSLCIIVLNSCNAPRTYKLVSPDNNISIDISHPDNQIQFSVVYNEDTLIRNSPIGLLINETDLSENVKTYAWSKSSITKIWKTINGKNKEVRNYYNEYSISLSSLENESCKYKLIFRCYDDGFAYRYSFPEQDTNKSFIINKELTQLEFTNDFTWWAYNGENHNAGPLKRSDSKDKTIRTPIVLEFSPNTYMAIHEAEIIRFAPFSLSASGDNYDLQFLLSQSKQSVPFQTSWRSFILGEKPGDLLESNLLVNLNESCKIEDTSWIKPGKAMWDWRVWGYKADDGFEYGLNTVSHKRFIDFASENNIQYLLIDADWYGEEFSETSDPTSSREGVDIVECMRYAREKNVGVILYLNDVGAKKFGLERVIKQFADWGAAGVKYGFMRGTPEEKVVHTRDVVELCAKYKLMVDFHDNPVPPSGDRRTWPNLMTKEFCHSQADALKSYFPETAVTSPFVNMIAGPLDMCDGWFDFNNSISRVKVFQEIPGTVAAEVAKLIVNYSGWKILPDSPEEYLKKNDLFDCIRKIPAQFDSFKVLDGQIGEFISVARGSGDDWFIGSLTNREARDIVLDLSFLPSGVEFQATLYEDTENTHFMNNRESYKIRKISLNSETKLSISLAPGGGHAIYIEK